MLLQVWDAVTITGVVEGFAEYFKSCVEKIAFFLIHQYYTPLSERDNRLSALTGSKKQSVLSCTKYALC